MAEPFDKKFDASMQILCDFSLRQKHLDRSRSLEHTASQLIIQAEDMSERAKALAVNGTNGNDAALATIMVNQVVLLTAVTSLLTDASIRHDIEAELIRLRQNQEEREDARDEFTKS